jgi:hypothetical protein
MKIVEWFKNRKNKKNGTPINAVINTEGQPIPKVNAAPKVPQTGAKAVAPTATKKRPIAGKKPHGCRCFDKTNSINSQKKAARKKKYVNAPKAPISANGKTLKVIAVRQTAPATTAPRSSQQLKPIQKATVRPAQKPSTAVRAARKKKYVNAPKAPISANGKTLKVIAVRQTAPATTAPRSSQQLKPIQKATVVPAQKPYTAVRPAQKPYTAVVPAQRVYPAVRPAQRVYPAVVPAQKPSTAVRPAQRVYPAVVPAQKPYTAVVPAQKPYTAVRPAQKPSTAAVPAQKPSTAVRPAQKPYTTVSPAQKVFKKVQFQRRKK